MSRKRLGRLQRIATIIPLALLSAAWTASVAGIGSVASPVVANEGPGQVTDGTSVPEDAVEDPVSLTDPSSIEGLNGGNDAGIVSAASTNAIPAAALAAYQRAETVINSADESCNITWQLIAAIGRVESNHGRFAGNVLNDDGVATPGIYGLPLNGQKNTQAISDTDAGVYDNDTQWDRAVGPMQFIPSTWQVVGVDADDDASRNPQDIDDAALAAAVYLCSGEGDLATVVGQRAAVYRYNHSQAYVDLVLKIMNAYLQGDFTSVPNNSTAAGFVVPEPPSFNVSKGHNGGRNGSSTGSNGGGGTKGGGTGSTGGNGGGDGGDDGGDGGGDDGGTGGIPGGGTGGGDTTDPGKTLTDLGDTVKDGLNNVAPDTGDAVETTINGLLGPLTKTVAASSCDVFAPPLINKQKNNECRVSYGLAPR